MAMPVKKALYWFFVIISAEELYRCEQFLTKLMRPGYSSMDLIHWPMLQTFSDDRLAIATARQIYQRKVMDQIVRQNLPKQQHFVNQPRILGT